MGISGLPNVSRLFNGITAFFNKFPAAICHGLPLGAGRHYCH